MDEPGVIRIQYLGGRMDPIGRQLANEDRGYAERLWHRERRCWTNYDAEGSHTDPIIPWAPFERDNYLLKQAHGYPRPRKYAHLERRHFYQEGRAKCYAIDREDPDEWVHSLAFMKVATWSLTRMASTRLQPGPMLPLRDQPFAEIAMPITFEMRCGLCPDCKYPDKKNLWRSPLWARGLAMHLCKRGLKEWDDFRVGQKNWWTAICQILCREYPMLVPARNAMLQFGAEHFPILPALYALTWIERDPQ